MADFLYQPTLVASYLLMAFATSLVFHRKLARIGFAWLNVAAVFAIFFAFSPATDSWRMASGYFTTYFIMSLSQFVLLQLFSRRPNWLSLLPVWSPVMMLILLRLSPEPSLADYSVALGSWSVPWIARSGLQQPWVFAGFSYVAFRLSLMALELRSAYGEPRPGFHEFLAYTFFLPHFLVGPISPFRMFRRDSQRLAERPWREAFLRLLVGLCKFYFLSGLVYQMTFTRRFHAGMGLTLTQVLVSAVAYTLYMYLNFSGFCDVMIGLAAVLGFESSENFDRPLWATDLRQFWNRWHMSLTRFLQVLIFNPLVKDGARCFGPRAIIHLAPFATLLVFLVMGVWHGGQIHYLLFSLFHAIGLIAVHYYGRWRGPRPIERPHAIRFASWAVTFSYVTICFFFFENDWSHAVSILKSVRI